MPPRAAYSHSASLGSRYGFRVVAASHATNCLASVQLTLVTGASSFSISKYPITVREWNQCSDAKACALAATGKDDAPVTNVSWTDAKQFVAWLAATTRKPYRLPSEAEWEYAARGGIQTKYWWGDQFQ